MNSQNLTLQNNGCENIEQTVLLTGSKSESNRALILQALAQKDVFVQNFSAAADTKILQRTLASNEDLLDVGHAGTAMRFSAAYLAVKSFQPRVLTGSNRMKQRPIGLLVDALRELGAEIQYVDVEGYPPLRFSGKFIQKNKSITINGNISSQFISALLLVAPILPFGLELKILGDLTSQPYVEMTLDMLSEVGIAWQWRSNDKIIIPHQDFKPANICVEPDWSAASYWYAFALLAKKVSLDLPYLKHNSKQGDSVIAEMMKKFGIHTSFQNNGIHITKLSTNNSLPLSINLDFKNCPDLAQTLIVCCAAMGLNAHFSGLKTLKIKETDRIKALQTELRKIGVELIEEASEGCCTLRCEDLHFPEKLFINTYDDHRMAMAFAPLIMKIPQITFENYCVVEKSYPNFWNDLRKVGFTSTLS